MKEVVFCGNALEELRSFPVSARREAGYQLDKVQNGKQPSDWKPMNGMGSGVVEIRIREDAGAFRVVYVAKLAQRVYVLHCFQKKTQRTSHADAWTVAKRYRELMRELGS